MKFFEGYNRFEARCFRPEHNNDGRCRLSRTIGQDDGVSAHGRVLGLLPAWLMECDRAELAEMADRGNPFFIASLSHHDRMQARTMLLLLPNASDMATHEREQRPGEPVEPYGRP